MQLHRSEQVPDWLFIKPEDHTIWQALTARTRGFVTPGNLISVAGLMLSVFGFVVIYAGHYWFGLGLIAAGRLLDLLDGLCAKFY